MKKTDAAERENPGECVKVLEQYMYTNAGKTKLGYLCMFFIK
jgi:hypothetical protein